MNDESEMMSKETVFTYFEALLSPGGTEEDHRNCRKLETENRTRHIGNANGHVG
jgi:hypothetical protein